MKLLSTVLVMTVTSCASDEAHDLFGAGKEDGAASVLSACASGIALPDVHVEGYVVHNPVPPQSHTGELIGEIDALSPMPVDLDAFASVDTHGALSQRGWLFSAHQGEQFQLQQLTCTVGPHAAVIYGPISTSCSAPLAPN